MDNSVDKSHHQFRPMRQRFWDKVEAGDGCWMWTGTAPRYGYLWSSEEDRMLPAHRVSWRIHRGEIPDGLHVLHRCDQPRCVRPDHLFLGTHADNMEDMVRKGRQRGLSGEDHPMSALSNDDAAEIKRRYVSSDARHVDLAEKYGVSEPLVAAICAGRNYPGVAPDLTEACRQKSKERKEFGGRGPLNDVAVQVIRWVHENTDASYSRIGRAYGIHKNTVAGIVRRETYKYVPGAQ